ncbi:unnamed protein product [Dicrocoelium dendriticum]|nr:unnamed protein product [Dicrocoelium dendriticum]
MLLINLQDWATHLLATDPDGPPLPPPITVANEARRLFLSTLLDWEEDLKEGLLERNQIGSQAQLTQRFSWSPTSLARGQFRGFLSFLHCLSPADIGPSVKSYCGLSEVRILINSILQEREHIRVKAEAENRRRRKHLRKCLSEIRESSDRIEENLNALAGLLKLLVPDPFCSISHTDDEEAATEDNGITSTGLPRTSPVSDVHRAHGRLCGTSSGLGLSSTDIEIRIPCAKGSVDGSTYFCIPVQRTEEVQFLEESARERAVVARDKHKPLLLGWLKTLSSMDSSKITPRLRDEFESKLVRVRGWLERLLRLTHLFFDRLIFTDATESIPQPEPESSSDTSDLEDVKPVVTESTPAISQSHFNAAADKSSPCSSLTPPQNTEQEVKRLPLPSPALFECLPDKSSVIWRSLESGHPFWRPIDPAEYETPKEYIEDAISCIRASGDLHNIPVTPSPELSKSIDTETGCEPSTSSLPASINKLTCWAPLLSNRLCPRRDPSGRCPIHGRIVRRDPTNGRPVDPEDRKLLRTEAAEKHRTMVEARVAERKRRARKRYPGLWDLKEKPNTSRSRLSSRVFKKKTLLRMANELETEDRKAIAARFSDNFVHSVKPW